jgi:hypothetical protein
MLKAKRNSLKTIKLKIKTQALVRLLEIKCLKTPVNISVLTISLVLFSVLLQQKIPHHTKLIIGLKHRRMAYVGEFNATHVWLCAHVSER